MHCMIRRQKYSRRPSKAGLHAPARVLRGASVAALLVLCLTLAGVLYVRLGGVGPVPGVQQLRELETHNASEVYAAGGELLGKYFLYDRSSVSLREIPPFVIEALIATEDERFFRHRGTDYRSMMRVLVKNVILGQRSAGGGSTLTRQLAKNLYPRSRDGVLGLLGEKLREGMIARRLENAYDKEEILLLYLNTVHFGENVYGLSSAALRFFNKAPSDLKPEEGAVLIGMLKAGTSYNPRLHPKQSRARRNLVLAQMVRNGYLDSRLADSLQSLPLELDYRPLTHIHGPAPYFRERLRLDLLAWLADYNALHGTNYNLYTDGLRVHTSLDAGLQETAERVIRSGMQALQQEVDRHYRLATPDRVNDLLLRQARRMPEFERMKNAGREDGDILESFRRQEEMLVFDWDLGERVVWQSKMDSLFRAQQVLHAGLVAMEPGTGYIRAWVGGNQFRFFQYDHVTARRQAGSAFKPLLYLAALESGIDPCAHLPADSLDPEEFGGWSPANAGGRYEGYYSMAGALARSVNTVSARILAMTGYEAVEILCAQAGISPPLPRVPSLSLGTTELSLLELTTSYALFANGGTPVAPRWLLRVEDAEGHLLMQEEPAPGGLPGPDPEHVLMLREMLLGVAGWGTASRAGGILGPFMDVAGKTGTTQNNADSWFIGFTPGLVAGIWTGLENPAFAATYPLPFGASSAAVPLWTDFFLETYRDPETRHLASGRFPPLPAALQSAMDCPPFLENLPRESLFDRLFRSRGEERPSGPEKEGRERRRGLLRRILEELF